MEQFTYLIKIIIEISMVSSRQRKRFRRYKSHNSTRFFEFESGRYGLT